MNLTFNNYIASNCFKKQRALFKWHEQKQKKNHTAGKLLGIPVTVSFLSLSLCERVGNAVESFFKGALHLIMAPFSENFYTKIGFALLSEGVKYSGRVLIFPYYAGIKILTMPALSLFTNNFPKTQLRKVRNAEMDNLKNEQSILYKYANIALNL